MQHEFYSLSYFNHLELYSKGEEVYGHGDFVDTIKGIVLYQYGDFVVECYYNPDSNEIEAMTGISIEDAADKYVKIEDLLL